MKRGIEMDRFKNGKQIEAEREESPGIDLLVPVTHHAASLSEHIIRRALLMLDAKTFDEIYGVVDGDIYSFFLDMETYRELEENGDMDLLKERLIVHFYSRNLHKHYVDSVHRKKGRKGDKLRRFFKAVTTEPKHVLDLAEEYELEYTTVKNHRRFDPYPERGITKIKNWMIFRQPVDG